MFICKNAFDIRKHFYCIFIALFHTLSRIEVYMKKVFLAILITVFLLQCFCGVATAQAVSAFAQSDCNRDGFIDDINNLFSGNYQSNAKIDEEVYLGGYPLGITIDGDGVTVIGLNEFVGKDGTLSCPAMNAGIEINDVIIELDGRKIYSSAKLSEVASFSKGRALTVKLLRNGQVKEVTIIPEADLASGQYRLGLWTRDSSSGIGTLTYVRKNLNFGSLGHPICDSKGNVIECKNGGVFKCEIDGIQKGRKGAAGELKGSFSFEKRLGSIYLNNKFGAFGKFNTMPQYCNKTIAVADINEITPGKAEIYCTLDNNVRKSYQIEIVKASSQSSRADKGLVIHVTDEELLEKTGGIVQGMSGSPIVQNGKLVGAVTHVFVNDPTRGYGIYAKWMLTN